MTRSRESVGRSRRTDLLRRGIGTRRPTRSSPALEGLEERCLMAFGVGLDGPIVVIGPQAELASLPASKGRVSDELLRLADGGRVNPGGPNVADVTADHLMVDAQGRVAVTVTGSNVARLRPELEKLGFEVRVALPERFLIEGFMPINALPTAETRLAPHGLLGMIPIYRPQTGVGAVTSQADFVLEADRVRNTLPPGLDGSGVKVGVISDSFNRLGGYGADIASGDLPNDVQIVLEGPTSGIIDEGRAMAQLVHDLAPGADLAFGSAFFGQGEFGQIIRDLANPAIFGASVITDDIFYFEEPLFQDGLIAQGINDVVTNNDVAYFALAGNLGSQSYESTSINFANDVFYAGQFYDFNPGAGVDTRQRITIGPGQTLLLNLQWDDPFFTASGVDTDLDVYVLLAGTNTIITGSARDNPANQQPTEFFGITNNGGAAAQVDILINLFGGPAPGRLKWVNYGANNSGPIIVNEFATNSPTVVPHSAAMGLSVGAVPFFSQTTPESFTSLGPNTFLFDAAGNRLAAPEVRQTPDIASIDGTDTTFFGSDFDGNGFPNFFGTSAAAPHAAAIGALLRQAEPGLSAQQVYDRLTSTAIDIHTPGFDNLTGAGLVDAYTAIFGAVVPASLPVADGFESGALSQDWETRRLGSGRTLVTTANGPASGSYHLTMDSSLGGFGIFGLNEAILHVDASAASGDVLLSFRQREFNDADDPMPATFTDSVAADGVALSVDGVNWFRIVSLTGSNSQNSYQDFEFNLTEIAAANGLTLGPDTRIKFQQYGSTSIGNGGFAFDGIGVEAAGVAELPTIAALIVNPSEVAYPNQRSIVRELAVDVLGGVATAPAAAFTVTRQQDGATFGIVVASITPIGGGVTRIVLNFTGTGTEFGSLPDGDYVLRIDGGQILDADGQALDADGDGAAGGINTDLAFHRFFGDIDGDRDVDALDFLAFRQALLTQDVPLLAIFDFNNDGTVNAFDTTEFYKRRGRRLV